MLNLNFVALDFETANRNRSSICEIGISVVRNSEVVETRSWLVRPEGNRYEGMNIAIHGIHPADTASAPSFAEVWSEVLPYLHDSIVVAHNVSFDIYALRDALQECGIEFPTFKFFCSQRIAQYTFRDTYSYSLGILSAAMGIPFPHHHRAGGDAEGCARVFLRSLELAEVNTLEELQEKYRFHCGEFGPGHFISQLSKGSKKSHNVNASDIVGDPTKIDEGNYFYGKTVCFTGKCMYGTRTEMLQMVADIGGVPSNNVSGKTEVLVIGQQDYRHVGEEGLSNKQKKAMELRDKGQDIEILSELEFMSMI